MAHSVNRARNLSAASNENGGSRNPRKVRIDPEVLKEVTKKFKKEVLKLDKMDPVSRRTGYDVQYELPPRRDSSPGNFSSVHAVMACNRAKNRYYDVLPYDFTRVVLKRSRPDGCDYINASHIEGPSSESCESLVLPHYIATQGPLENTVADFWDMVVQQKCVAVLMLTREIEGQKVKCGHYFPADAGTTEQYGHIRVTTTSRDRLAGSFGTVVRMLQVEDSSSVRNSQEVAHFHYEEWPDHGTPSETAPIRHLIRHIRTGPLSMGPFLVHCSAGIGRTGTYCCVDFTLRRVLAGDVGALDVPATIEHMRAQRSGMVQTREQLRFCYAAILDELEELVKKPDLLAGE